MPRHQPRFPKRGKKRTWEDESLLLRLEESVERVETHIAVQHFTDASAELKAQIAKTTELWRSFQEQAIGNFKTCTAVNGYGRSLTSRRDRFNIWTFVYNELFNHLEGMATAPEFFQETVAFQNSSIAQLLQAFNDLSLCWYDIMADFRYVVDDAKEEDERYILSCRISVLSSFDSDDAEIPKQQRKVIASVVLPASLLEERDDATFTCYKEELSAMLRGDAADRTLESFSSIVHRVRTYEEEREGSVTPTNSTFRK